MPPAGKLRRYPASTERDTRIESPGKDLLRSNRGTRGRVLSALAAVVSSLAGPPCAVRRRLPLLFRCSRRKCESKSLLGASATAEAKGLLRPRGRPLAPPPAENRSRRRMPPSLRTP